MTVAFSKLAYSEVPKTAQSPPAPLNNRDLGGDHLKGQRTAGGRKRKNRKLICKHKEHSNNLNRKKNDLAVSRVEVREREKRE